MRRAVTHTLRRVQVADLAEKKPLNNTFGGH